MKSGLIINGASGRMGRRVLALAAESSEFNIIAAVEAQGHPDIGKDAGTVAGIEAIGLQLVSSYPAGGDVMVDFSLPAAADRAIEHCVCNNISLVMATTGLSESQVEKLSQASEKVAIVKATNFSVGMNVLFNLVGKAVKMLGGQYDIEIVESHHRFKKDSPSGTALTLAENIAEEAGLDWPGCLRHGREGKEALRENGTIGMQAIRAGDIVGEHSVIYGALGETVTLSHRAHNRDNFARGALRAAMWLSCKEAGLYLMGDVLGISAE